MRLRTKFQAFTEKDIPVSDKGAIVKEITQLLKGNEFEIELLKSLEIDSIQDEFISIPGAKTALDKLASVDGIYKKIDYDTTYRSLDFDTERKTKEDFAIKFTGVSDEVDEITAFPIYSAQTDFFSKMNGMDKYASQLFSKDLSSIVYANLELLQKDSAATKKKEKFRLLKEVETGIFFLRAIVSHKYRNYDNKVALFVALITLHKSYKETGTNFRITNFEYSESYIRIFFESDRVEQLKTFGEVTQVVEVSNDEIKSRALTFKCLLKIGYYDKSEKVEGEIFAKPPTTDKYNILRITHGQNVDTAIEALKDISRVDSVTNTVFEDARNISAIDKPDFIRDLVKRKIEGSRVEELQHHKNALARELEAKVDSMYGLLKIFNKLNLVTDDPEVKEYLRYLFYDALRKRIV
jgi:hypothetical protein